MHAVHTEIDEKDILPLMGKQCMLNEYAHVCLTYMMCQTHAHSCTVPSIFLMLLGRLAFVYR